MPEVPISDLHDAVRKMHGCDSTFVGLVPVREEFRGETVWDGVVAVFDLIGHPAAKRAYAWSMYVPAPTFLLGADQRRFIVLLHAGRVDSPVAAVRASIVAEH
jgi:hypothetical protein